jgi:DNA polymerase III, delta subunit
MKLTTDQLAVHLKGDLAPVYVIAGDEPLLILEAVDAVRARAREAGYTERHILDVEVGFNWDALLHAASNLSLFALRRLVELRMPSGKPGDRGSKTLVRYVQRPPEDAFLLVSCGKLDAEARKSEWLAALGRAGIVVQAGRVDAARLPRWIDQRMRQKGLQPSREAVAVLAERVEGNLLAAAQEIEKLLLLRGAGPVTAEEVAGGVASSARFECYLLADSAIAGQAGRSVKMLDGLRAEGEAPLVVLWALAQAVRTLAAMSFERANSEPLARILARHRVWESRKALVTEALSKRACSEWQSLLQHCAHVDRVIKGQSEGRVWDELLQLTLRIAVTPRNYPT